MSQLFATMKVNLSTPAIVTSHSSYIGDLKCEGASVSLTGGSGIELPFSDARSYYYAKKAWSKVAGQQFLIVTHTDGCGAADKEDERTFWLVDANGLSWDDEAQTVDIRCHAVAHQDVIHEIDLSFGTSEPLIPGNTTIPSNSTTPTSSCAALPSDSVDGLPSADCGAGFDKTLDDKLGYINLLDESSFAANAEDLVPGLGDYNFADYTYEDTFVDNTNYTNTLTRRKSRHMRLSSRANKMEKRLLGFNPKRMFQKMGDSLSTYVIKPAKGFISATATAVAKSPLGPILDRILEKFSPKIDQDLVLSIKPKVTKKSDNWGEQFQIYQSNFTKKNGLSGSMGLYCVNCSIDGNAKIQGRLLFSLRE